MLKKGLRTCAVHGRCAQTGEILLGSLIPSTVELGKEWEVLWGRGPLGFQTLSCLSTVLYHYFEKCDLIIQYRNQVLRCQVGRVSPGFYVFYQAPSILRFTRERISLKGRA